MIYQRGVVGESVWPRDVQSTAPDVPLETRNHREPSCDSRTDTTRAETVRALPFPTSRVPQDKPSRSQETVGTGACQVCGNPYREVCAVSTSPVPSGREPREAGPNFSRTPHTTLPSNTPTTGYIEKEFQ